MQFQWRFSQKLSYKTMEYKKENNRKYSDSKTQKRKLL